MANTPRTSAAKKTTARKTTTTTRKPRTTKPKVAEPLVEALTTLTDQVKELNEFQAPQYALPEDPTQRQALVDAYYTLAQAGAPIPDSIRIPVEDWIANVQIKQQTEAQTAQQDAQDSLNQRVAELNISGPRFVRNMTNNPFNLRLDSQQGSGNIRPRRLELKPRGMPGDMHPIKDEDKQDPVLITNLNLGLIEIIQAGEAQLIIENQTRNMNKREHTPTKILQNEYKVLRENHVNVSENPTIRVEAEFNSQGVTVATLDPSTQQGRVLDRELKNAGDLGGGLSRGQQSVNSQFIPTGGNPASISFDPLAVNRIQDDIARRKDIHGPAAGLGDIKVTVEPTRRG